MEIDITNFLPKYPDILEHKDKIFNPYPSTEEFNEIIYKKKEFYDEKLSALEEFPTKAGDLTKHQKLISRFFSSHTIYDQLLLVHEMGCVSPETPILKWDGGIRRADEIKENDILIGDDGMPRNVVSLIDGTAEMFEIHQNKAETYVVNGNHILTVKISGNFAITWTESIMTWTLRWFDKSLLKPMAKTKSCKNISKEEGYKFITDFRYTVYEEDDTLNITVNDYMKLSKSVKSYMKGYKCPGIQWDNRKVVLDPYILGMWLGDGNSRGDGFTSADDELVKCWEIWAEKNNSKITHVKDSDIGYYIRNNDQGLSPFKEQLREYNLIDNKHIPREYIVNDRQTRLKVLAGLIDTDGYVYSNGTCIEIFQKNIELATQLCYLIRSLGFSCQQKTRTKSCMYKGQKREGLYECLSISGKNLEDIPVILSRKKLSPRKQIKDPLVTQIKVTSIGIGKYVGWELDCTSNKRFLLGDFTVTHNTGKTCVAISSVEQIKSEGGGFKGCVYFAKGEALINNFINELIFKCTDGRYIPEDYEELTDLEKVHRKKKAIKDYYSLETFETFAKSIKASKDVDLQNKYNNHIIIIDEIHNLRMQSKEKGLNIYKQFHRFLHVVKDCKILLMSGTPMKDGVDEIASVMNLILPLNKQLVTGEEFLDEYFTVNKMGVYKVKSNKVDELKELFKGRVSYLKAMQSDIKKVFMGKNVGNLVHLNVVEDFMSEFQSQAYNKAYDLDRTERQGVYANSRQASLFVFPDSSCGESGFKKFLTKKDDKKLSAIFGKQQVSNYSMNDELSKLLNGGSNEEKLVKLEKYSSKYAASIRTILKAREERKSVFIYNEYVKGSGLILFALILNLFGFAKANGSEPPGSKKARYASLTNETTTNKQITDLISRFNNPDNMNGEIINVIMGSRKISEGFSFKNIQVEDIHTPWYNYSETSQAIARGFRLGSHRALIDAGLNPTLDIYQRVSIPKGDEPLFYPMSDICFDPSIDLFNYELSEIKDISIKGIERLMKISAWDCALNYSRNSMKSGIGYDGERECDYMDCDYVCDGGVENIDLDNKDLDYSTFQLYYDSNNKHKIIDKIVLLFKTNFRLDMDTIIDNFPEFSGFELITALYTMINESTQIINKYGFSSFMKEDNNIFFLVDSLSVVGRFSSDYYTEFPHVKTPVTFNQVVQPLYLKSLPDAVKEISSSTTISDIRKIMYRLPIEVHEYFIEASILARKKGIQNNKLTQDLILQYFENSYTEFNGVWVSWLLYDYNDILRCLNGDIWEDCNEEYIKKIENFKQNIKVSLEKNQYGYYGQYNKETDQFCIRDVQGDIAEKKHLRTSGKRCINWPKDELLPIIIDKLKIQIPDESNMEKKDLGKWKEMKKLDKNSILAELRKSKNAKDRADENSSREELLNILFWSKLMIKPTCKYLRDWFQTNNLLSEDPGCGKTGKVKI